MRDDWDDEARRAYDQGYWDARRELEGKLEQHGRSRQSQRMDSGERFGEPSRPSREEPGSEHQRMHPRQLGFEDRSGGRFHGVDSQRSDWRPEGATRFDERSDRAGERFPGGEPNYRRDWRQDESGYRRNWDERSARTDRPAQGDRERDDRWQSYGRSGPVADRRSDRSGWERSGDELRFGNARGDQDYRSGQRDLDPGERRDLSDYREQHRDDRDRDRGIDDDRRRGGEDRGFFERAGSEIRSWFGGDDDERREYERRRDYPDRRDDDERPYISGR